MHYDTVKHELYPDSSELEDFSYACADRLARLIAGERYGTFPAGIVWSRNSPTASSRAPPVFGAAFGTGRPAGSRRLCLP